MRNYANNGMQIKHLESWITQDGDPNTEIKTRIEMAREIFIKLKTALCNGKLNFKLKRKYCKSTLVLLNGHKTWNL